MSAPDLRPYYRKVERLIGRYHEALARAVAKRPNAKKALFAFKATDPWQDYVQSLIDEGDGYFDQVFDMGVEEAGALLKDTIADEIMAKMRKTLGERKASNAQFLRDRLVPDIRAGKYDANSDNAISKRLEDETAEDQQARLGFMLDTRVGMYADALWPQGTDAVTTPVTSQGVLVIWTLDPMVDQHCDDCEAIADGNPYSDPDIEYDDEAGAEPLPTYPGDGDTQCLMYCRCWLSFEEATWNEYAETLD